MLVFGERAGANKWREKMGILVVLTTLLGSTIILSAALAASSYFTLQQQ